VFLSAAYRSLLVLMATRVTDICGHHELRPLIGALLGHMINYRKEYICVCVSTWGNAACVRLCWAFFVQFVLVSPSTPCLPSTTGHSISADPCRSGVSRPVKLHSYWRCCSECHGCKAVNLKIILKWLFRDDDDINDVATMGGVNLSEESRNILSGSSELIGAQVRSCRDEPFLDMTTLNTRIQRIGGIGF